MDDGVKGWIAFMIGATCVLCTLIVACYRHSDRYYARLFENDYEQRVFERWSIKDGELVIGTHVIWVKCDQKCDQESKSTGKQPDICR